MTDIDKLVESLNALIVGAVNEHLASGKTKFHDNARAAIVAILRGAAHPILSAETLEKAEMFSEISEDQGDADFALLVQFYKNVTGALRAVGSTK